MPRTRKPGDQLFKKTDIYRLIESVQHKNLPIAALEATQTSDGTRTVRVIVVEADKIESNNGNDLDNWMAKHHADQAEGH